MAETISEDVMQRTDVLCTVDANGACFQLFTSHQWYSRQVMNEITPGGTPPLGNYPLLPRKKSLKTGTNPYTSHGIFLNGTDPYILLTLFNWGGGGVIFRGGEYLHAVSPLTDIC